MPERPAEADLLVVGAGAAGLMAAIQAGRRGGARRIAVLDGARRIGAKILVSGGGRCNVTHERVDGSEFAGSTPGAIRRVLKRFGVPETVSFFRELGVDLKREPTGKLFPASDEARSVLDALVGALRETGALLLHPRRVATIRREEGAFRVAGSWGEMRAPKVILATGGKSLPKTGSDGQGYLLATSLGHTLTPRILPALVPLVLRPGCFVLDLAGVAAEAAVEVRGSTGRRLAAFTGPVLCTHFGLSGPAILDASRFLLDARAGDPGARLVVNWVPGETEETADAALRALGPSTPATWLAGRLPARLARAIAATAGEEGAAPGHRLGREARRRIAAAATRMEMPVIGDRGFAHAEVTAGGVPLSEIDTATMASRRCEGLHLCGEICDVDGRIGGFNFQWAWSSGWVAGVSA